jgi:hypothetical protein
MFGSGQTGYFLNLTAPVAALVVKCTNAVGVAGHCVKRRRPSLEAARCPFRIELEGVGQREEHRTGLLQSGDLAT